MVDVKLISLIKVIETGSFTKAAEALSLTQPAVSQHIQQLQDELHVKLIERSHNELRLTKDGEIVMKYAKRIQALYNNMSQELKDRESLITSLNVGLTHTSESNAIAETLAKYAYAHEGRTIKITTGSLANLRSQLKNYELDFIIVEGRINDDSLKHLVLDTDYLVLAVAPEHPLAKKTIVSIDDLKKERLLLRLPNSNTRNLFVSSLEAKNMSIDEFNIVLQIDNIATIKDLVRRQFGVSVVARSACLDEINKKKLFCLTIEDLSMTREINIVYRNDYENSFIFQDIIKTYNELVNN